MEGGDSIAEDPSPFSGVVEEFYIEPYDRQAGSVIRGPVIVPLGIQEDVENEKSIPPHVRVLINKIQQELRGLVFVSAATYFFGFFVSVMMIMVPFWTMGLITLVFSTLSLVPKLLRLYKEFEPARSLARSLIPSKRTMLMGFLCSGCPPQASDWSTHFHGMAHDAMDVYHELIHLLCCRGIRRTRGYDAGGVSSGSSGTEPLLPPHEEEAWGDGTALSMDTEDSDYVHCQIEGEVSNE